MFDCLRALATLDDAGIEVVSLTEQDSGDKSMRKLIRPILAWLAERYSEELGRARRHYLPGTAWPSVWSSGTKRDEDGEGGGGGQARGTYPKGAAGSGRGRVEPRGSRMR